MNDVGDGNESKREGSEDYLKQVIESPLWVLVRDFLTSTDVLEIRTAGLKWNSARLYGSFTELFFFPHESRK